MNELPGRVRSFLRLEQASEALFVLCAGGGFALLALLAVVFFSLPGWVALAGLIPLAGVIGRARIARDLLAAARRIESGFPVLRGRLVPAVQLAFYAAGDRQGYSLELAQAAVADAWQRLQPLPVRRLVRWQRLLGGLLILVFALALIGVALTFAGTRVREGLYWSFAPSAFPLELSVAPGHARVEKGQTLVIRVVAKSPFAVKQATLKRTDEGRSPSQDVILLQAGEGRFEIPVTAEFDYWVECRSRKTPVFHVGLKQPLGIASLIFRYRYPAYSRIPENSSQAREIAALVGTRIELQGEADHELARGGLAFSDSSVSGPLRVQGRRFAGEFTVRKPLEFDLRLEDVTGSVNGPERFRITPITDEYPLVRLFAPGADMNLPSAMKVVLGVNSMDDYGLGALILSYTRDSVLQSVTLRQLGGRLEDTTLYLWDLSRLDLLPGSSIRYYVTVYDNDAVSGPKSSRSETFTLRFPTMTELFNQATEKTAEIESLMAPFSEQQRLLQEQTGKVDDALKRNRQLSWEDQQSLRNVMMNQDSLLAAIRQLREDVRREMDNLFEGVVMDSEAYQGLRQLDTLLSQVLPQQMLQALDSLRSAMSRNPQNLKPALDKLRFSQADMQKAIERAVELLKRLRQEQEMNALARKAEELYREQEKIQKNARREGSQQLAQRQEQIRSSLDSLAQQARALGKELDEKEIGKELSEIAQQMESDSLAQQAQAAAQDYQQGKTGSARQKGQKLQDALKSLSQRLQQMKEKMGQKRSSDIAQKLLRAADDLLTLSDAQEGIEQRMARTRDLSDLVGEEKRLADAARIVAETLAALSSRTMQAPPQLGEPVIRALVSSDNAAQALESSNPGTAQREAQEMRASLNQAVAAILKALEQGQQGGGMGGGMESLLEQLSRAISGQMSLGQELGGMLPIPMPGGMSPEMMQQWQDLLARQQALREALEQLMQSMGGQQPGMTSSADAAIEEMKQLERDMALLNPQRPYLERNERIVNKLLDAQRSIRQREYTEKRESEAGKQFLAPPSPQLPPDLGERKKLLREQLMRALKEDFPREYEPYVRAYFEALLK
jgi:hypothetical protein